MLVKVHDECAVLHVWDSSLADSSPDSSYSSCKLNIALHDGNAASMDLDKGKEGVSTTEASISCERSDSLHKGCCLRWQEANMSSSSLKQAYSFTHASSKR